MSGNREQIIKTRKQVSGRGILRSETGMVSIIITLVMMIVISLIVLGFATVTRRNQREALDRQLSTQAYYAAESGVNDAASAIVGGKIDDLATNTNYQTDCNAFIAKLNTVNSVTNQNILNAGTGVKYTCLLVTNQVADIEAGDIAPDGQKSYSFTPSASTNLDFKWHPTGGGTSSACPSNFTSVAGWGCSYGILRVDFLPDGAANNADALAAGTATFFMVPASSGGGTVTPAYGTAKIVKASCSAASGGTCHVIVQGPFAAGRAYHVRLTSIYETDGNVTINGSAGVTFSGAQTQIDATGQAQDVLRRIQVRLPLDNPSLKANDALASGHAICKQFTIEGPGTSADPSSLCNSP